MNWTSTVKDILGKFWLSMFSDKPFVNGAVNTLSHCLSDQGTRHESWLGTQLLDLMPGACGRTYVSVLYLEYKKLERQPDGSMSEVSLVSRPPVSLDSVIRAEHQLTDKVDTGVFITRSPYPHSAPQRISDHVMDSGLVLKEGLDYEWRGDSEIRFHVDPAALGLPTVALAGPDGSLVTYFRTFGWFDSSELRFDPVAAMEDPALNGCFRDAWTAHQEGATMLTVKKLLAWACGAVVCECGGQVSDIWTEQDQRCILIGDRVYHAPLNVTCNVARGDRVKAGQVLLGDLQVESGDAADLTDFPFIEVMTDAGVLTAKNSTLKSVVIAGTDVRRLPLEGTDDQIQAYERCCGERIADPESLEIRVPDTVNPFEFVVRSMRGGRQLLVSMGDCIPGRLAPVMKCIRRNMDAGCMISVRIKSAGSAGVDMTASSRGVAR